MGKQFKIEVEGAHPMIADLLEDLAPKTCAAFWESLPFENEMLQVKWSGCVIYVFSKMNFPEAECSRCHGVCPGDMLYNPHVHDAAEHPHEIAFVYGPASMATVSGYAISNLFARIRPQHLDELYALGDDISHHGLRMAKLSRIED
jgi:hypothetical protein